MVQTESLNSTLKATVFNPKMWSILTVLIAWGVLALFTPPRILPSPYVVFSQLLKITMAGEAAYHMSYTLMRIALGFTITMFIGIAMGIAMGLAKYWESFLGVYVSIGLTIPSLTWAILGVMWFGMTEMTPVFGTFMIVFPYVAINIWEGVKSVQKDLVDMARSFGKSRREIITKVLFPSLMPFLFASVRYAFAMSWKIVVIAEMFVASQGVGYMIYVEYAHFSVRGILSWVLLFTIFMFIMEYGVFRVLEKRALAWRPELVLG